MVWSGRNLPLVLDLDDTKKIDSIQYPTHDPHEWNFLLADDRGGRFRRPARSNIPCSHILTF